MPNQTDEATTARSRASPTPGIPSDPSFGGFWKGGKHWSEVIADDAIDFLEPRAGRDAPFFMYLAFNAPHDPRQSPQRVRRQVPARQRRPCPRTSCPSIPTRTRSAAARASATRPWPPSPVPSTPSRSIAQEYYAIITHIDAQIGRILDALEASGKADDDRTSSSPPTTGWPSAITA